MLQQFYYYDIELLPTLFFFMNINFTKITDMNVIFAVTEFMKPIYDKLADFLGQGENVGTLPKIVKGEVENADALTRLIKTQYESITSKFHKY